MLFRLLLAAIFVPQVGLAAVCKDTEFEGISLTICEARIGDDLRLFHSDSTGVLGSFAAINEGLEREAKTLGFAMNAGMYHPDRSPVGLYVENGREESGIVTRDGPGNFGLLPNGVFCIAESFRILESRSYAKNPANCRFATQSGPMLVIKGKLHPRFLPGSTSEYIRNGVGVTKDGTKAIFAISNERINFHRFARFFRDALGLSDALYFDGKISRLYAPELGRHDAGFPMGPIVGSVLPKS